MKETACLSQSSLNLKRGLVATFICSLVGAVGSVALALAFTVSRWLVSGTTEINREYDLRDLQSEMLGPVIGCAVVLGCAGWATYAPAGSFRFVPSLVFIFSVSVALWSILLSMQLTPRRFKSMDHPAFYPSELIVLFGPPILAAIGLTAVRIVRGSASPRSPEA